MCRANLGLCVERSAALGVVLAQSRHEVFILGGALDGVHRNVLPYGGHGVGQCDPPQIGRVCAELDEAFGGLRRCAVVLAMGDVGVVVEIGWSMCQVASRVQESAPSIGRTGAPRSGFSRPNETPGGRITELVGMWFFTTSEVMSKFRLVQSAGWGLWWLDLRAPPRKSQGCAAGLSARDLAGPTPDSQSGCFPQ